MTILELVLTAVGLSMDAFAVSICKGLSVPKIQYKHAMTVGIYFGSFQAGMPVIGYLVASLFAKQIAQIDHWISFVLLAFIGAKMIKESFENVCCETESPDTALRFSAMIPLAVATSIDALAAGVTFAFLSVDILWAAILIGATTCLCSMLGIKIGNVFGARYKAKAEFAGGAILILLGLKILLQHLGIISF